MESAATIASRSHTLRSRLNISTHLVNLCNMYAASWPVPTSLSTTNLTPFIGGVWYDYENVVGLKTWGVGPQ